MFRNTDRWLRNFTSLYEIAKSKLIDRFTLYLRKQKQANEFFNEKNNFNLSVFSLDATAFKTAARTDPELYLMNGPVVEKQMGMGSILKKRIK